MSKLKKSRNEIEAMVIERVNARAKGKIVGIEILSKVGKRANWSTGIYLPPSVAGTMTEVILMDVIMDLQREFDISS
jgi:hypothetical protein